MTKMDFSSSELALAALASIALIFCFSIFNGASAETISKSKYQALEKNIMAEYKAAKILCASFVSSEKIFCATNAETAKDKSKADLDSSFAPTIQPQKIEKSDEFIKDETVTFEGFNYKSNPFDTLEFNNIYHVKA